MNNKITLAKVFVLADGSRYEVNFLAHYFPDEHVYPSTEHTELEEWRFLKPTNKLHAYELNERIEDYIANDITEELRRLYYARDYKDYLDRHARMQRLNNRIEPVRDTNPIATISIIGIMTLCLAAVGTLVLKNKDFVEGKGEKDCSQCHSKHLQSKAALIEYFAKKGSKTPEEMANAVLATRSPRLMAAMARVESGATPTIRRSGHKKRHDGAFQVNPRHWGKVSHDPIEQAIQAEAILTELVEQKGSITKGLNAYGGDVTRKTYAKTILAELVEVPK